MRCLPLVCKGWTRAFADRACGPSHVSLRRSRWSVLPPNAGFQQQQQGQASPPPPLSRAVPSVARFSATVRSVRVETGFSSSSNPVVGSAAAKGAFEAVGLVDALDAAAERRNAAAERAAEVAPAVDRAHGELQQHVEPDDLECSVCWVCCGFVCARARVCVCRNDA